MRRILAKLKNTPQGAPFIVYRQSDGYPCVNEGDSGDELISKEDLLFPDMNESGRHEYETAVLQGLLSNPNIVKNIADLDDNDDFIYDLLRVVDKVSAHMYFDGCTTYK